MFKTGVRKYDIFKMYYWHGATLVGKYRMPQLKPTQSIPHDVIGYNERSIVKLFFIRILARPLSLYFT